jgi:hypothetical protein
MQVSVLALSYPEIISQKYSIIRANPTPSGVARPPRRGLAGQECCLNTLILLGGQGGAPLGLPPPLGERGGHPRKSEKFEAPDRILPSSN